MLRHSWLDQESSLFSWIPAFAGMTLCLVNYGLLSKSGWGGQLKHWTAGQEGLGHKSWTEHYLSPKDTNGALITLASIEYLDPEVVYTGPGRTIRGQS